MDRLDARALVVGALCVTTLLIVGACDPAPPPPSSTAAGVVPSATTTDPATPAPTATPEPPPTLTIALDGSFAGGLSDAATGAAAIRVSELLHDGLYELDHELRPVPRLADAPPAVSADGRTWTVHLRDGLRFADGTPLVADDVVRTYDIARSARCPFRPSWCLSGVLEEVGALGDDTVVFTLRMPWSPFATTALGIGIERAEPIESAYAAFVRGAEAVSAADTAAYLESVAAEEARPTGPAGTNDRPTVDYAALRGPGEALLATAGVDPPDAARHTVDGELDLASYVGELAARVRAVDATFTSRPDDALAAAYPFLASAERPVTTGPYQLPEDGAAETPGSGGSPADATFELVANPEAIGGPPAIERIVVERGIDEAAALAGLRDGTIDWRPALSPSGATALGAAAGIDLVRYPEAGFYGLTFNLHPEGDGLFLDRALREAVARCFDPAVAVRAAVGDAGIPIRTEIPTYSWAYPASGLATYGVDRERATTLIEGAGWTLGEDGIYERDGRRLSTVVPVREGAPERTAWLRSVGDQVRGCGIDLQVAEVSFSSILRMLAVYPHVNAADADGDAPFDAYFGGLDTGIDPDPYRLYHSAECTSAERPDTFNFGCYADPTVDRLLEAGRTTTDLATRAQLYGELAAKVSVDLPIIFAWSGLVNEARRTSVATTDPAGLPTDTPTWYRPLERLTIVR